MTSTRKNKNPHYDSCRSSAILTVNEKLWNCRFKFESDAVDVIRRLSMFITETESGKILRVYILLSILQANH